MGSKGASWLPELVGPVGYVEIKLPWLPEAFFKDPHVRWEYLSPLMPEWTHLQRSTEVMERELLALLRDSRLANWSRPEREPVCMLDDLGAAPIRRRPVSSGTELADAAYAAGLPRALRVVLAALHAARGLEHLCHLEVDRQLRAARVQQIPWGDIARTLGVSRQAAQERYRGRPADVSVHETWRGSEALNRYESLLVLHRDLTLDDVLGAADRATPFKDLSQHSAATLREMGKRYDRLLEITLYWQAFTEQQRRTLATMDAALFMCRRANEEILKLTLEARTRLASWRDIGLALGITAQGAHQRLAGELRDPRHLHRELSVDFEQAVRTAQRIVAAASDEEALESAKWFLGTFGR
ncbi:hypothetical protein ACFYNM_39995 [Streptomyces spororaveus]|uniref:hypothetical protein n=1 Tax=Streptomyces spororaveus TaxID=284039 RepID=UPI0036828C31